MPYIIINDKDVPWTYYTNGGFHPEDASRDEARAHRFTITEATEIMHRRADLYAMGWRIVPVRR